MIRLVVGLGNPGPKYAANRHNVGFMVLAQLGAELGEGLRFTDGHRGRFAEARVEGREVVLLEPATYMNRSGDAVVSAMDAFAVATDEILVVHDELDVPFGGLKLKLGGGAAGHNGLRSIIERCGDPEFGRLRVGIGRPEPGTASITDWVLGDFSQSEGAGLDPVLDDATRALRAAVADGIDVAMRTVNARRRDPNPDLKTDLPRSDTLPGPKPEGKT